MPVDAASLAVAPTHVDLDEERTDTRRRPTSYQLDWPMSSGSFGPIPANRGSAATTAAQASAGVVTEVTALGDGLGVGDGALDAQPTTQRASSRTSDR